MTEIKQPPELQANPEPLLPPSPVSTEATAIINTVQAAPDPHTALVDLATRSNPTPNYFKRLEEIGVEIDSGRFIVGDEIIGPTATMLNEPDSKGAYERGWLSGIGSASRRKDIPDQTRRENVEAITKAAITYGVPFEKIRERLQTLGHGDLIAEFDPQQDESPKADITKPTEKIAPLTRVDLSHPNNTWLNVTEDAPIFNPNDPEAIKAVRDTLSKDEKKLVFRMMSRQELQNAIDNGYIGGETIDGQVEAGVTWWGDQLRDSLNQRRGKIYRNSEGVEWGGSDGMLIAIDRRSIQGQIVEKRKRPSPSKFAGYDAYKTSGKIPLGTAQDVYRVSKVRDPQAYDYGFFRIEKLVFPSEVAEQ